MVPLDDLGHGVGVVAGPQDALQGMAVGAVADGGFLLVGAGQAVQPLGVRELGGHVGGLAQFQVGGSGAARADVDRLRAREGVTNSPDAELIVPGGQLRGEEAVTAVIVAHHRDGD